MKNLKMGKKVKNSLKDLKSKRILRISILIKRKLSSLKKKKKSSKK